MTLQDGVAARPRRRTMLASAAGRAHLTPAAVALMTIVLPTLTEAQAKIDAHSRIDAVTVYPDAALVTRVVDVDLPEGDSVLTFKNLSPFLDSQSLRVTGEAEDGAAKVTIGEVEAKIMPAAEAVAPDDAVQAKLKTLRAERGEVQSRLDELAVKRTMIMRFAQTEPAKLAPDSKPLAPVEWGTAWDTVDGGLFKLDSERRLEADKATDLDDQIWALTQQPQSQTPEQAAQQMAIVSVAASRPAHVRLRLSYRVTGIGWTPVYDAALDTAGKRLVLTRRASLSQHSGEDWTDVALTVSTARVAGAVSLPDVLALRADFPEQYTVVNGVTYGGFAGANSSSTVSVGVAGRERMITNVAAGQITSARTYAVNGSELYAVAQADAIHDYSVDGSRPYMTGGYMATGANALAAGISSPPPPPPPPPAPTVQATAQIESGAYSAEFKAPGRVTLTGDGGRKTFTLEEMTAEPTLLIKAAPARDQTGYLLAHFTDSDDAPILPGPVDLHRDGAFVGQGRTAFVAPGDGLDLGFGGDDKIKITRAPVNQRQNDQSSGKGTRVDTREFLTTVKNLHDFPVKVQLIDQTPFAENTAITIDMLPATTPPTSKDVDNKRGVMAWTFDLAPGETKEIHLAYRIKWPSERGDLVFTAAR